jgi:hypothetical protein
MDGVGLLNARSIVQPGSADATTPGLLVDSEVIVRNEPLDVRS